MVHHAMQCTAKDITTTVVNPLFSGGYMKWNLYAEPDVYLSEDRYNMKARKIEDLPECTWVKDLYSELKPEFSVISQKSGEGLELTKRGKVKQKYSIVELKSSCATACFETELLNQFLQKTSKLYLAQDDGKLLVKNRNWIYFVASSTFDKVLVS